MGAVVYQTVAQLSVCILGSYLSVSEDGSWQLTVKYDYIDGLVQGRRNSIANALELRLSCTNPLI